MDTPSYVYLAIALLTLSSVLTRTTFMLFGEHIRLPEVVRRALRYAPVAALVAIIVPDLLPWHADTGPSLDPRLFAGLAGYLAFVRTRSALLIIVTGMATLWLLHWLF